MCLSRFFDTMVSNSRQIEAVMWDVMVACGWYLARTVYCFRNGVGVKPLQLLVFPTLNSGYPVMHAFIPLGYF